jgi:hypothetical protein
VALEAQIEPSCGLDRGDGGDVAVINGFLKPALGGTAIEPGAPQRATGRCAM